MNNLSIGLNARLQFDRDPPIAAFLAGGLVQWVFSEDQSNRWGLRFGGGYGEIAHLISLSLKIRLRQYQVATSLYQQKCRRLRVQQHQLIPFLTKAGKVYYQLGFNYAFKLSEVFAITFTTDFLHMIALQSPPDFPSKHFDFSLGIEFTL